MYMNQFFMHGPWDGAIGIGPAGSSFELGIFFGILFFVFIVWELFWKGLALWHAARNNQWGWFIALLLIHTIGILDIVFIFGFRKDRLTNPLFGSKKSPAPPHPANPPAPSTGSSSPSAV